MSTIICEVQSFEMRAISRPMQKVLNAAIRLVLSTSRFDHNHRPHRPNEECTFVHTTSGITSWWRRVPPIRHYRVLWFDVDYYRTVQPDNWSWRQAMQLPFYFDIFLHDIVWCVYNMLTTPAGTNGWNRSNKYTFWMDVLLSATTTESCHHFHDTSVARWCSTRAISRTPVPSDMWLFDMCKQTERQRERIWRISRLVCCVECG